MILETLLWIFLTLLIATTSAIIAKKHGPEYIIGMYVGLVVIANILASKIIHFAYWDVPAAVIVYSATFLLTDMLSEFYSKKEASKAIWAGFMANIALVISLYIASSWEPASFWGNQQAFETILSNTPRIVFASLVAYLISQTNDIRVYEYLKNKTGGKHLWLRNNVSTMTSQFLDSVIFVSIAFYGLFPITSMIIGQYAVKLIIAALDTPFIYAMKRIYK